MNFEFSLSEVLERLIPGAIFITLSAFLANYSLTDLLIADGKIVLSVIGFCFSYLFGTLFNILGSAPIFDNRRYWNRDEPHVSLINQAVKDYFKLEPTDHAWKLCYGVCHKNNYTVKSELFARLNVYCRSMSICFFLLFGLSVTSIFYFGRFNFGNGLIAALLFFVSFVFWRGARLYSQSFVGSIYEGFYSFYSSLPHTKNKQDIE